MITLKNKKTLPLTAFFVLSLVFSSNLKKLKDNMAFQNV
ncbi:uncharacterized protein METZ01_LOCUS282766, partial [marine metagenome]